MGIAFFFFSLPFDETHICRGVVKRKGSYQHAVNFFVPQKIN
jgi:hypothetical protein